VDETIKKLEQQDKKLDAIYASAEKPGSICFGDG
jgi:hypothetical protein